MKGDFKMKVEYMKDIALDEIRSKINHFSELVENKDDYLVIAMAQRLASDLIFFSKTLGLITEDEKNVFLQKIHWGKVL